VNPRAYNSTEPTATASGASALVDSAAREPTPRVFSIDEFCRRYGIGRTSAYQEMSAYRLRAVKVGRRTLITQDAAEAWLAALRQARQPNSEEK
jgi:excisionase family DNA binding protein